jgi:hydrogenase/urease accessory protein HupE
MKGRLGSLAGLVVLGAFAAAPAHAHTVGISRGEYRILDEAVEVDLVFARRELTTAIAGLDRDRDGNLSEAEVTNGHELLERTIVRPLQVSSGGVQCSGRRDVGSLTEQDGLRLRVRFACRAGQADSIRAGFVSALSTGHRHIAVVETGNGEPVRWVAFESRPDLQIGRPGAPANRSGGMTASLFRLGLHHILTGYDHLLFLIGLIVVGGRLRPLLMMVTAFTIAHSITLGLAVLEIGAPSPRIVEPAIALSICYVAVENWFIRDASRRWLVTAPFGLVHGFGFAGALREIALPSIDVPLALASFNLGVEAGQLAVLALLLPLVWWLGRRTWFPQTGVKAVSAAVGVAGLCWFVARVAG